jgi:hypothetical protein
MGMQGDHFFDNALQLTGIKKKGYQQPSNNEDIDFI